MQVKQLNAQRATRNRENSQLQERRAFLDTVAQDVAALLRDLEPIRTKLDVPTFPGEQGLEPKLHHNACLPLPACCLVSLAA